MEEKRNPGYYWIRRFDDSWIIADWYDTFQKWRLMDGDLYEDNDFKEIDEKQIIRGEEQKIIPEVDKKWSENN